MNEIISAIKLIYPNIKGGFVYWKTKHDGTDWDNPIDGLEWENTKYKKPTWDQIQTALEKAALLLFQNKKARGTEQLEQSSN